jgi:hypothetical protein
MANVIVFNSTVRNQIRGGSPTNPLSSLEPVLMTDGRYYVGTEILSDPAYAAAKYDAFRAAAVAATVDFETIRHLTFGLVRGAAQPARARK